MNKILLIDGHSILNRAFYGVPPLTNFEGLHTNAVYGFINIMLKSLEDEHADYIAVAFDLKAPTFRHEMFAEYKGTRKPMPQELHEQVPVIKEVLAAMTIPVITLEGYEADDILGTLAKRCQRDGFEVSILSGDRDLLQLADEHIKIRMPKTVKGQTSIENYYPSDVIDKYQVTPEEFIDLKALMGDSSDNIPGVPGIGEKTATAIITFKDNEPIKEDDLSDKFCYINDYAKADEIIRECMKSEYAGIRLAVCDGILYGAALAFEDKYYYIGIEGFITQDYLADSIKSLSQKIHLYTINLKSQVDYINRDINDDTDDLAIMQYLINPLKDAYTYAELAREYLNRNIASEEDILGKNTIAQISENAPDKLMQICCYDAYTALMAHDKIYDKLCSMGMKEVYHNIELPIIYVLRSMEHEGIRVNREALKSYGDVLAVKIDELRSGIYEQAGTEFNINSPKQLGEILFDRMGIEGGKKTKTGYSTSAEVLEKLAPDFPIVNDILEYRTLAKLKSTYADGLADYIRDDGRIHGTFNQTITATGRISSTEPNLQNIPIRMDIGRQIRKVFIPKEGYIFTDADYSQIELRLLAHMSGDETLINAYREDKDIHKITASKVFKTPLDEVTPKQRSNAKAVNFGIVYGISSFGLSKDLGISRKEAKEYIDEYFKTYPSIKDYLNGLVDNAKKDGYSITLYGRKRPVPELTSSNFMQRQFGERIAMNSPLQGTAADIIKIAMINVYKRLIQSNLKSRLILQIHDELLIETAPGEEDEVKRIMSEEMEGAAQLKVPLEIDIHSGNNWYEAK